MKHVSWRWALTTFQVGLAVVALLYAPTQYRHGRHAIWDDSGLVVWRATYPPPSLRIVYAINFPALVGTHFGPPPPRWTYFLISTEKPFCIVFDTNDFAFVVAVGLLWTWVGRQVEVFIGIRRNSIRPMPIRRGMLVLGCLFTAGIGFFAAYYTALSDADKPYKQIGPFGLAWFIALAFYLSWRVRLIRRPSFA